MWPGMGDGGPGIWPQGREPSPGFTQLEPYFQGLSNKGKKRCLSTRILTRVRVLGPQLVLATLINTKKEVFSQVIAWSTVPHRKLDHESDKM